MNYETFSWHKFLQDTHKNPLIFCYACVFACAMSFKNYTCGEFRNSRLLCFYLDIFFIPAFNSKKKKKIKKATEEIKHINKTLKISPPPPLSTNKITPPKKTAKRQNIKPMGL